MNDLYEFISLLLTVKTEKEICEDKDVLLFVLTLMPTEAKKKFKKKIALGLRFFINYSAPEILILKSK